MSIKLERQKMEGVPQKTFFFRVEYNDSNRRGERITEYVAIDGEEEFYVSSKAAVAATSRAGNKLYDGNIAPFSNVSATLLTDEELAAVDPTHRGENGQPITIREICLSNKLVWVWE